MVGTAVDAVAAAVVVGAAVVVVGAVEVVVGAAIVVGAGVGTGVEAGVGAGVAPPRAAGVGAGVGTSVLVATADLVSLAVRVKVGAESRTTMLAVWGLSQMEPVVGSKDMPAKAVPPFT